MPDPRVRTIATVEDMDGMPVVLGVSYDTVTVRAPAPARFTAGQAQDFAQAFTAACWAAGRNVQEMADLG